MIRTLTLAERQFIVLLSRYPQLLTEHECEKGKLLAAWLGINISYDHNFIVILHQFKFLFEHMKAKNVFVTYDLASWKQHILQQFRYALEHNPK